MAACARARVALVRAEGGYDLTAVRAAVEEALHLIGGLERLVRPTDRVFVKVNHLPPPSPPDRGIVTHPVFVEAVLEVLREVTPHLTVGDDIQSHGGDGFQVSGLRAACERAGVRLTNLRDAGFVEVDCRGHLLDKVLVSRHALEADAIVNLPKLKTHSLTLLTGAVKNLYGTIPAGLRTRLHGEHPRSEDFAQALVDLFSVVRPKFTILDGIVAMEGEGPANGSPRALGLVLASEDAVALDAVATRLIGIDPLAVETTRFASERGLGVADLDRIEIVGERIADAAVPDFKLPATVARRFLRRVPPFASALGARWLSPWPRVVRSRCTGCRECARICPTGAASVHRGKACIDRRVCVRCLCCHEVCRFAAIVPRRSGPGRALELLASLGRRESAASSRSAVRSSQPGDRTTSGKAPIGAIRDARPRSRSARRGSAS